jgi:hypothetical protein
LKRAQKEKEGDDSSSPLVPEAHEGNEKKKRARSMSLESVSLESGEFVFE